MLILSRKPGEDIIIETSDGPVLIRVIDMPQRNRCRIGVDAPKTCRILRAELIPTPDDREG